MCPPLPTRHPHTLFFWFDVSDPHYHYQNILKACKETKKNLKNAKEFLERAETFLKTPWGQSSHLPGQGLDSFWLTIGQNTCEMVFNKCTKIFSELTIEILFFKKWGQMDENCRRCNIFLWLKKGFREECNNGNRRNMVFSHSKPKYSRYILIPPPKWLTGWDESVALDFLGVGAKISQLRLKNQNLNKKLTPFWKIAKTGHFRHF